MSRPRPAKADTTPTRRAFVPIGREVTIQRRRRLDHPAHDGQGYVLVEYHGSEDGKPFQVGAALFLFNARSRGYAARMARKMGVNLLPDTGDEDLDLRKLATLLRGAPLPGRVHTRLNQSRHDTWEVAHVDLRPSLEGLGPGRVPSEAPSAGGPGEAR